MLIRKYYDKNAEIGSHGLPTQGSDPGKLFSKKTEEAPEKPETPPVEEPKLTEPETPTAPKPDEQEEPQQPSEHDKLELARKGFIEFLGRFNPDVAEKLSNQQATGRAGYQQALAFANVADPNAVEAWRAGNGYKKSIEQQPVNGPENEEFDPYDQKKLGAFFNDLLDQREQQKQAQTAHEKVVQENYQTNIALDKFEAEIKKQLGEVVGSEIITKAYTEINEYGIATDRPGGAFRYAAAFNKHVGHALKERSNQEKQEQGKAESEAAIAEKLKKTMLQTQPTTSAPETTEPTERTKHLSSLQGLKPVSMAEAFKK